VREEATTKSDVLRGPTSTPATDYFEIRHLKADLRGRTVRGGVVTLVSQGGRTAVQLLSTMALARLIAPGQFGLFAMAAAITGFVSLFREMGLSAATVQRQEVNHAQVSVLFWVNVTMGVAVSVVMFALARPIAWFYGAPDLANVVRVLSIGPAIGGLAVQHNALLQRQMRFGTRSAINLISVLVAAIVAVVMAWFGAGYWALAAMALVEECVATAGRLWECRWRPGLPRRGTSVRGMIDFGKNLVGFNVVNYLSRNLDNVLVGRFAGAEALGLYSRAYGLLMMPLTQVNAPIASVAVPALSRLVDSPERYRRAYCGFVEKIQMITYLIVCSDWVIRLLLGSRWHGAAAIYALLGISGITQPLNNTSGWLFISQGRGREMFRWGLIAGALTIASFVVGLPWGALGVAAAYGISGLLVRTPLLLWYVSRRGPVSRGDMYRTLKLPSIAAAAVASTTLALRQVASLDHPIVGLIVTVPVAIAVSLIVYALSPGGRRNLAEAGQMVRQLLVRRRDRADRSPAPSTQPWALDAQGASPGVRTGRNAR
jgi:O-antigen/teichoic acid export membrane protein